MKKSTGIVFLLAVVLGAFVYYYEFKRTPPSQTTAESKSAFNNVSEPDITRIKLTRGGMTAVFERRGDQWYVTQPGDYKADQALVDGVSTELAFVKIDRTFAAGTDSLQSYGLDQPAVTLEFTLKNGATHKLRLGSKDIEGSSAYALVDDSKDVDVVADTILNVSDKPTEDFRDHAVQDVATRDATSLDLTNESGEISAEKNGEDWKIEKPRAVAADSSAVSTLLDAVSDAKITQFVVDNAPKNADLAKYGLSKPAVTFRVKLEDGKSSELQIGKKEGDEYYARDTDRPMIFKVKEDLLTALNQKFFDLRDKQVIRFERGDVAREEVRNQNGATACVADPDGDLIVDQGGGKKNDNAPSCPDFIPSLESAKVEDIYDMPPAAITAKLANPAVQMTITDTSGSKTDVRVSAVSDDAVYAQTSAGPQIFKLDKSVLDALNAKPAVNNGQ